MRSFQRGIAWVVLAVMASLCIGVAYAATHTVSWTKATVNTDGSAIPATGPGSVTTTVELGTCNADGSNFVKAGNIVSDSAGTSAPTGNLAFNQTICVRAFHVNTYGNQSAYTPVIRYTEVAAPTPNPPILVGVN